MNTHERPWRRRLPDDLTPITHRMAGTTRPLRPRSRRRHIMSICLAWLAALAVGLMLVAITVLTLWLVTSVQP